MIPRFPAHELSSPGASGPALPELPSRARGEPLLGAPEAAVLNALPLACYVMDASGRLTFCNAAACEMWGRVPQLGEELWCGSLRMFSVDGTPLALDRCPAAIALKERRSVRGIEALIERPDGTRRRVAPHPDPIFDAAGDLLGVINVLVDVTEQHRANLDAYRLAAIVESSEDAIISKTLDGVITSWNGGAQRLFGYTAEEAIGRPITLLIPGDRQHEELTIIGRLTAGQRMEHFETIRQHKDGRLLFVSLTVSPIRDRVGTVVGASKIARDITPQKRHEAELRRRSRRIQLLSETLAELLAGGAPDQILLRMCPSAAELINADTFVVYMLAPDGQSLHMLSSGGVPDEIVARSRTLLLGQGISGTVAQSMQPLIVARVQESTLPQAQLARDLGVRSYASLPLVANGRAVATIAFASRSRDSFAEDEIEFLRVLAQSTAVAFERRGYLQAVQRSEQQLRLVTDHAPIYLAHCDRDHRYKFVNRTYAQRYGRTPEDIVGRHVSELTGEEAYGTFRNHMEGCLAGHRVEFEMEIPYATLGHRWVHVIYEPERQADGAIVGLVAVIVDITARKLVEQELERARDEALAASRAKDAFLAALSHELRTPLNPVLLLASAAGSDPHLPAEVRADFNTIRKHVELEARLIEDLLDLTRISHGKLALQMASLDAHEVLRDALATVDSEVRAKSLSLAVNLAPDAAPVWGDPVRLRQVFWNIVNNAVKFTPAGGRIEVDSTVEARAGLVRVRFSDTGIGMTADEIARAFEAFAQGEHAMAAGQHRYGGLGLGLSISRMLVEAHGGSIRAVSAGRDRGTTLTIELPLHTQVASQVPAGTNGSGEAAAQATRVRANPTAAPLAPLRVLLVEDHAPTRDALARLLERRNCTLCTVGTMTEAVRCAETATFDLLVSDLGLPDGDGYELMAKLRARWPELPGIALSGYGMEEDLARAREAGFAAHLVKPVRIDALERAIAQVAPRRPGAEAAGEGRG